jgi:hypothetical protein
MSATVTQLMVDDSMNGGDDTITLGRPFPRFPILTTMTRGLQGIFIIGGPTGVGKSTLAAHLAADVVSEDYPGVYYETENRLKRWRPDGTSYLYSLAVARMRASYGIDARFDHLAYCTEYADALTTLRQRLAGFLVVDTIQGSLGREDYDATRDASAHNGINQRVHDFISLANEGYAVIVVSQINDRRRKAPPLLHHLKLSGALEQAAWIMAGYGEAAGSARSVRAFAVRKYRQTPPAEYRDAVLHLAVDDRERLTEAGLATASGAAAGGRELPDEPVLRALAQSAHPLTPTELAAKAKVPLRTVKRRLHEYRAAGKVEHVAGGKYGAK